MNRQFKNKLRRQHRRRFFTHGPFAGKYTPPVPPVASVRHTIVPGPGGLLFDHCAVTYADGKTAQRASACYGQSVGSAAGSAP